MQISLSSSLRLSKPLTICLIHCRRGLFYALRITLQRPMGHILNLPNRHSWHLHSSLGSACHRPLSILRGLSHLSTSSFVSESYWLRQSIVIQYHFLLVASKLPINLFAQVSNITLISTLDRPCTSSAPTRTTPPKWLEALLQLHNPCPSTLYNFHCSHCSQILPLYNVLDMQYSKPKCSTPNPC